MLVAAEARGGRSSKRAATDAMTDANSIEPTDVRGSCFWCGGGLSPHHYAQASGSSVVMLCSAECLDSKLRADSAKRWKWRRRNFKRLVVVTSLVAACVTPHDGPPSLHAVHPTAAQASAPDRTPLPGSFGPEWPPSEASLLADLGRDAWLHPLAGPIRRMPSRDSRVFGADRGHGERPIDCRKGHCGVDLGGEIWGEQVHAAHDGVVDRVQRGANDAHGGHYVRLAHRGGTVFTQYFHLAAVPRWVEVGAPVKAGDVIGLLGDSGVKESSAHLHFTVSVRPASDWTEVYVDPEPLIALWPLRIPLDGSPIVLVSTGGTPAVPLGGAPFGATHPAPPPHKHVRVSAKKSASEPSPSVAPPDDSPSEESSE
jgi:murein DD-endopeptidase MepM/ murein hydrolase activator NlpD